MTKIKIFKNGAWTSFDKTPVSGYYVICAFSPSGRLLDKMVCDNYRSALDYLRSFKLIARNA